jgi:hypothetical protein
MKSSRRRCPQDGHRHAPLVGDWRNIPLVLDRIDRDRLGRLNRSPDPSSDGSPVPCRDEAVVIPRGQLRAF